MNAVLLMRQSHDAAVCAADCVIRDDLLHRNCDLQTASNSISSNSMPNNSVPSNSKLLRTTARIISGNLVGPTHRFISLNEIRSTNMTRCSPKKMLFSVPVRMCSSPQHPQTLSKQARNGNCLDAYIYFKMFFKN